MMKYRSIPVVIEAEQLTRSAVSQARIIKWIKKNGGEVTAAKGGLTVYTPEGEMHASWNDYIIRGTIGEFYPCKPEVFIMKYAPYVYEKDEE